MRCFVLEGLSALGLAIVSAASGLASPVSGKLLPLVPAGCAIVAGFENSHGPHSGSPATLQQGELSPQPQPRVENLTVQRNQMEGSILLSDKQFDAWIAHQGKPQASPEPDRASPVAASN